MLMGFRRSRSYKLLDHAEQFVGIDFRHDLPNSSLPRFEFDQGGFVECQQHDRNRRQSFSNFSRRGEAIFAWIALRASSPQMFLVSQTS
jgi:hypothetical protein